MGILNITPDSFYSESRVRSANEIICQVQRFLEDGASIIDIGAYSTRPGASEVSLDEELSRIRFALGVIRAQYPDILISVDTFRSQVAAVANREFGVQIINDISGGLIDSKMFETVSALDVVYVLSHIKGTPQTMQSLAVYDDLMGDVTHFFQQRIAELKQLGCTQVILDPGFGFAKTITQNYKLLKELKDFTKFGMPILVGFSRKSMIYKSLDSTPEEALNGTTVLNTLALNNGASILRVHDVKEAKEVINLYDLYNK